MRRLIEGVRAFHDAMSRGGDVAFEGLARGQAPKTLFVTCSDSRVVPVFLASAEPGELFTLRNVGNLIPPLDAEGHSLGDRSEASAVEYAAAILGVTDVVVCGHSGCGAMMALLGPQDVLPKNLARWLQHARGALRDEAFPGSLGEGLARADQLSQRNVAMQLWALGTYPSIAKGEDQGAPRLHGWWFDIAAARIDVYAPTRGAFRPFDEVYASDPKES